MVFKVACFDKTLKDMQSAYSLSQFSYCRVVIMQLPCSLKVAIKV